MLNGGKSNEDFDIDIFSTKLPSQSEYLQQAKQTEDWRNAGKKADEQMAKFMVQKHVCKNIYKTYLQSRWESFVRIGKKRGKFAKRHKVLAGTVISRKISRRYVPSKV